MPLRRFKRRRRILSTFTLRERNEDYEHRDPTLREEDEDYHAPGPVKRGARFLGPGRGWIIEVPAAIDLCTITTGRRAARSGGRGKNRGARCSEALLKLPVHHYPHDRLGERARQQHTMALWQDVPWQKVCLDGRFASSRTQSVSTARDATLLRRPNHGRWACSLNGWAPTKTSRIVALPWLRIFTRQPESLA